MHADRSATSPALAITGAALQSSLVVVLFKIAPFLSTLATSGIGDPSSLVPAFEEFIPYCAVEFTLALLGLILLGVALVFHRYRAPWFFRFLVGYGVLLLPVVPVGTAFGLFFVIYCLTHRREFVP